MSTSAETCTFVLTFVVKPSEEIPDRWVGHCLELDVVSEGSSYAHALEMALEAAGMVVKDDLQNGRDPFERRAPKEFWRDPRLIASEEGKPQTLMQRIIKIGAILVGLGLVCLALTVFKGDPLPVLVSMMLATWLLTVSIIGLLPKRMAQTVFQAFRDVRLPGEPDN